MKPSIIMNWKMNPETLSEAIELSVFSDKKGFILCPPFVFLSSIKEKLKNAELGAQNSFWEKEGAFTGEISSQMLKKIGCKYIIIGHSERRKNLKEDEKDIRNKLESAININMIPIVCIGSKERNEAKELKDIKNQIKKIFSDIKLSNSNKLIVAYEPVWAISTNKKNGSASSGRIEKSVDFISKNLIELIGEKSFNQTKVIYGGSVNSENVSNFLKIKGVSGVLVGAASLNKKEIKKFSNL